MTKEEAIKLENRCDKIMSGYLGMPCTLSLALTGKLKVEFDDNFITWSMARNEVDWVWYVGFYDDLLEYTGKINTCISDNRDIFEKLVWSYEHRCELED